MSHFAVLICIPAATPLEHLEDEIGRRMERWNENRDVEPYRDYEEGAPENYWWVSAMRRAAKSHRLLNEIGAEALAVKRIRDKTGRDPRDIQFAIDAVGEQAPKWAEDAQWAERLGEHPTWEDVARLYNEQFGHGKETLHYEPESGRAYTVSTRNPESMWDYWRIGGRWGGYFHVRANGPGLITTPRGWDSPDQPTDGKQRADGGPKRLLDFDAMRDEAAERAGGEYDKWDAVCADTPPARSWEEFIGLVDAGEMAIDDARRQYSTQPRIKAARDAGLNPWDGCPVTTFMSGREEYVAEARRGAVPGYALVTLDEEWVAPGRMGWWGMSSDGPGERSGYRVAVNVYLEDKVADDDFVIALDCHI